MRRSGDMPGPVPPQGEDESEKAMETAALLTAAAAEQWEASLARLKNEINRCDIETKVGVLETFF